MHGFVKKGLLLSLAAGSLMVTGAGAAAASDSAATEGAAADSPGLASGNVAQVPADVPVQVCGDAASVAAAQTDAEGNSCDNVRTGAKAVGAAADSPGAVSGDVVQVSANAPVQACGDALSVLGFGTGAEDNHCVNG
ncbi:hypothetical protein ABIA31_007118 [Catenulispora sp. MAP5-51]|uniref:chaplin n=1 Tax=Catenulispora sp. MAP5-51 TaxID=3156298 RepID=UPI003517238A